MKLERKEAGHHPEWIRIINSVALGGLKSASKLISERTVFYPSADTLPRSTVMGINISAFIDGSNSTAERQFISKLYNHANALLPVIMERPGEIRTNSDTIKLASDDEIRSECERRAAASFLIAFDFDKLNGVYDISHIPSRYFDYAIFPEGVYDRYTQLAGTLPFPNHIKIIRINGSITRYIKDGINMKLRIPDYEGVLKNILNTGVRDLFAHGVRLPLPNEKKLFTTTRPY